MNPTFTVHLEQHTPLIHFQHTQEGATLRATEVKPKLDRFIIEKLKTSQESLWKKNKDLIQAIFRKTEKGYSGNYKLRISADIDKMYVLSASGGRRLKEKFEGVVSAELMEYTPFFADAEGINTGTKSHGRGQKTKFQNGNFEDVRLGLMFRNIEMHFSCFFEGFESFIKNVLPAFFANTNFGTRQTKGFGSFSTKNTTLDDFKKQLVNCKDNLVVYYTNYQSGDIKKIVKDIQNDYKLLKAGDNQEHRNIYEKSLLWKFMCDNNTTKMNWEKRKIKEYLSSSDDPNLQRVWNELFFKYDSNFSDDHHTRHNFDSYYVRALLGLAEHFEFKTRNRDDSVKIIVKEERGEREDNQATQSEIDTIDRFPSPILFKVFKNHIFILGRKIDSNLYTKEEDGSPRMFSFELNAKIGNDVIKRTLFSLPIPQNFDIEDFLNFALDDDSYEAVITGYNKIEPNYDY